MQVRNYQPTRFLTMFDNGYVFIYVSYLRQKLKSIGANVVIEGEEMGGYELKEL